MNKIKYLALGLIIAASLLISSCKKADSVVDPIVVPSTNGTVSGRITSVTTSNPIIQALVTTNPATASVSTDIYGYYSIDNVKPGAYTVYASKNGYDSSSTKITVAADLVATAIIQLKTTSTGILKGTVVSAATGSTISYANITTNPYMGAIKTDAYGTYSITNVKTGSLTITAEKFGYTSKTNTIVVVADSTKTVDFVLQPVYGTLTGTVTDSTKNPIAGANITTTPVTSSVLTDTSGKYVISNISPAASFTITAKKGGWKTSTVIVGITAGLNTIGDIIMSK